MVAIAYIRQSKRADLDVALSRDTQLAAVQRLAGDDDIEILEDLGRSGGRGKEHLRPDYQRLLARIEAGQVSTVFALNLSRLARSVPELHRLMTLAKEHDVRIVTAKEGTLDPTTTTGRLTFGIFALLAEFVRDLAVDAANENVAERRKRGDTMGRVPYGEREGDRPDAVIAAWDQTRSLGKAAKLLNEQGVPSWSGGLWTPAAVRLTIGRIAPDRAPSPGQRKRGVKPSSPFRLYRLLFCPCGRVMTGYRDTRWSGTSVIYRCHDWSSVADHPAKYRVREDDVLDWIEAEAARLDLAPGSTLERAAATERQRHDLIEQRRKLALAFARGGLDDATYEAEDATLAAALDGLDRDAMPEPVGPVDFSWPPEAINAGLRALWRSVKLDADLRPVKAEWRVPEWRR